MMNRDYEIFELEIGQGSGLDYPLTVLRSAAGEARATLRLPYSELALDNRLKDLEIALLHASGLRRQILPAHEQAVQGLGRELFDALLTGEVRSRYDVSQERARQQGKGMRVRLRIQAPELAVLPWEFLFDSRAGEYVCLSRNTPLVRYLEVAQPVSPLAVTPPLRILTMMASPSDLQGLNVPVEKQRIEQAVAALQQHGTLELHWLPGGSWRDLQRAMRSGPWHVFHFVGHGGYDPNRDEGLIALVNTEGKAQFFTATDLGRLLADHTSLRLVLLNACEGARGGNRDLFSSTAATLVRRGLPAVVAMQYPISDSAAIEFSQTFYESLADNLPVDAATAEARKAIAFTHSLEWGTPVLYMRASDGQIFNVQSQPSRPESTQRPPEPSIKPLPFDWVTIPAGAFTLGSLKSSDAEAFANEQPQQQLTLSTFQITRTEVTVAQFARFVAATGYKTTAEQQGFAVVWQGNQRQQVVGADWACPLGGQSDVASKAQHPVTCVSWLDAQAFCAWAGVRLPTEAEWEKAARGQDGRLFPWGNRRPELHECNINLVVGDTKSVGENRSDASPYGVLDMAGNVWEWTNSLYRPYPYQSDDGREEADADGDRVLRGGSFVHGARHARCACRFREKPDHSSNIVGFRVVYVA